MSDSLKTTRALMNSFKFSEVDLEANREGKLSGRQKEKLVGQQPSALVQAVMVGHFVIVIGLLGLIAFASQNTWMFVITLAVIAVLAAPFSMMAGGGRPALRDDVAKGQVMSACGDAVLTSQAGIRGNTYSLMIAQITFKIEERTYRQIENGRAYCAYYLPQSRTLLSIEAV